MRSIMTFSQMGCVLLFEVNTATPEYRSVLFSFFLSIGSYIAFTDKIFIWYDKAVQQLTN